MNRLVRCILHKCHRFDQNSFNHSVCLSKDLYLAYIFPWCCVAGARAGNSLIWFPSKLLVFCPKMSEGAICSKKRRDSLDCSFLVNKMSNSLTSLISSEWPARIAHGRSFLVSEMCNSLISLIWFERNEWFTHIAHQKRGNEPKWEIPSFLHKNFFLNLK